MTPARKIGGALAAGCSLILKASEETPGACVELVRCFADAGLPAGVLNLVFGVPAEVSEYLLAKDAVRKVSFTGSIPVGKHRRGSPPRQKRTTMELGGHSPVAVFADADLKRPPTLLRLRISQRRAGLHLADVFNGQQDVYAASSSASPNMPRIKGRRRSGEGHRHGPDGQREAYRTMKCSSTMQKPRRTNPDRRQGAQPGLFRRADGDHRVPDDSKVMTQEPFGPLAPVATFKTFDEVVERANSLEFGLAAYALTTSNATAAAIGDALDLARSASTRSLFRRRRRRWRRQGKRPRQRRRHRGLGRLSGHQVHFAGVIAFGSMRR